MELQEFAGPQPRQRSSPPVPGFDGPDGIGGVFFQGAEDFDQGEGAITKFEVLVGVTVVVVKLCAVGSGATPKAPGAIIN